MMARQERIIWYQAQIGLRNQDIDDLERECLMICRLDEQGNKTPMDCKTEVQILQTRLAIFSEALNQSLLNQSDY